MPYRIDPFVQGKVDSMLSVRVTTLLLIYVCGINTTLFCLNIQFLRICLTFCFILLRPVGVVWCAEKKRTFINVNAN